MVRRIPRCYPGRMLRIVSELLSERGQVETYPSFRAELYARGPKPGGFECARNEDAANVLFLQLATLGVVVWVDREEGDTALGRSI